MDTSAAVESAAAVRPGVYTFVSQGTDTVIDLARGSSADGTDILSWQNHNGDNQHWQVAMVQNFEYLILNDAAGTYFTAPQGGNGQLTGNLMSPTDNRVRWRVNRNRNGTYEIESIAYPGRVVDNASNSGQNGNPNGRGMVMPTSNGGSSSCQKSCRAIHGFIPSTPWP